VRPLKTMFWRSSLSCIPAGLVTLVAITTVAVPSVVIIHIAVVVSIVAVLDLTFIYIALAVLIIAVIGFFSRAINKIVKFFITTVVNLVLRWSNIMRRRRSLKGRAGGLRSGGHSLLDTFIAIVEAKGRRARR
jgi:hypothetical protein